MLSSGDLQPPESAQGHPTLRILRSEAQPAVPAPHARKPVIAALTDTGLVRRSNEDQYLVATLQRSLCVQDMSLGAHAARIDGSPGILLAVADGVGGVRGGEIASAVALDAVAECFLSLVPRLGAAATDTRALATDLRGALESSQVRMRSIAARKGLDARLGTTLTVGYVAWPRLLVLHVGDSRAYSYRHGVLTRLTRDQTAAQELLDAGLLRPHMLPSSPLRHMLTSAVGGGSEEFQLDVQDVALSPGDVVLLCTDGLYDELSDETIAKELDTLQQGRTPGQVVSQLIEAAKAAGGRDNVTAVLAAFPG